MAVGLAADPTNANVLYAGFGGGGLWKTTNGGASWTPLTDQQASLDIGAVALAPSNPSVVYAGTGSFGYGRGLLKSTDGGATWTLIQGNAGVNEFDKHAFSRIVVDPSDPNTVYAAIKGGGGFGAFGSNQGIWKSTDGGQSWTNTTASISDSSDYTELRMDPANHLKLFAAIGGDNDSKDGVYVTTNGGTTWSPAGNFPMGTSQNEAYITLAIAPSNDQEILAAITNPSTQGLLEMLESTDGGSTWKALANVPNYQGFQGDWDSTLAIDPSNPGIIYAGGEGAFPSGGNGFIQSVDGGSTWTDIQRGADGQPIHADNHATIFDADGRLVDGNDGGVWRLDNATPGQIHWTDLNTNLSTIEFYGTALDPQNSNIAYGGSQDNGCMMYTGSQQWTQIFGGDGGLAAVDFNNPSTVYLELNSFLSRSDDGGSTWTSKTNGINTNDPHFFPVPFAMDQTNSSRLVLGTDHLYETTDKGDQWNVISTPGVNGFNPSDESVVSVAVSKSNPNTIYVVAGLNDIFATSNDGASWQKIDIPNNFASISDVEVDPTNSQIVYAVRAAFNGGLGGHLYKSTNGGGSWTDISGNMPDVISRCVTIGPSGVLYLGTDVGVYTSVDSGQSWSVLGSGLPNVHVNHLEWNSNLGVLAASTYGRGMWEILIQPTITANLVSGQLQIQGTSGATNAVVRLAPGDPSTLQVLDNGTIVGSFATSAVSSIAAELSGGNNTLVVDQTNGDLVPAGGLSYEGSTGGNTLVVNGAATTASQTITLDTKTPAGDTPFSTVSGMSAGTISYEDADTSSVLIETGTGADTIAVHATGIATTMTIGGTANVVVGNVGTLAEIAGPLTLKGPNGSIQLTVDDSADATAQAIALSTADGLDDVTGVGAAGPINYQPATVAALTLRPGTAAGTVVNVQASGSTTNIVGSGPLSVIVGNAGSVQAIDGPINLDDPGFAATLVADDSADHASRTVTLTSFTPPGDSDTWGAIAGLAPSPINYEYADTSGITINGGTHGNTFNVQSTQAGTALTLNTGSGSDIVNLGSTGNKLDSLQGPITINGQSGSDTVDFKDQGQTSGQSYTLTPTTLARPGIATVRYGTIEKLSLSAGSGNDDVTLSGTLTVAATINGGTGTNTLSGPNLTSTWNVSSPNAGTVGRVGFSGFQNLVGGSGKDTFKFSGSGSISGTIVGGGGTNTLDYSGLTGPVTVNLQTLSAPLVDGGAAGGFTNIQAFTGSKSSADTLIGADTTNLWTITTPNAGKVGADSFKSFENLIGGSGVDTFKFMGTGSISGKLDGGAAPLHQGNWLDYSALSTAVTVNLQTGAATGALGGVKNIQNVHGSNGGSTLTGDAQGNILIGGTGNDTINGGTGASLLIGDKGADTVRGGSGGDILIGDYTTFDAMTFANQLALMSILAEWQSSDSYATRFADIDTGTGGGLNGTNKLNFGTTVKDDGTADTLIAALSSQALDWFFQGAGDTTANFESGEHINNS